MSQKLAFNISKNVANLIYIQKVNMCSNTQNNVSSSQLLIEIMSVVYIFIKSIVVTLFQFIMNNRITVFLRIFQVIEHSE